MMTITREQLRRISSGRATIADIFLESLIAVEDITERTNELSDIYPTDESVRAFAEYHHIPLLLDEKPHFELAARIGEMRSR
jgi:hypothetical protein